MFKIGKGYKNQLALRKSALIFPERH